ncbi:MAG: hypothetical protein LLG93_18600 [Deltaproteobacteria bacterium]|nr:hypothetical protein [Deltaproteobacteria bacterium]
MVRAIDRHESILQSSLTERIQQIQQQHADVQQRYFEMQLSQEHRRMLQKVNESDEKESVRAKGEGEKRQRNPSREDHPAPKEATGTEEDPSSCRDPEGHIDIKV